MKKTFSKAPKHVLASRQRNKLYLAVAAQCLLATSAYAAPKGGQVVGGTGSIEQSDSLTTVTQETQNLAVDWESFNVDADETVRFVQPGADSVALNRILDNDASQIFGQIEANGKIILANPNGVFFGRDATINVGSLVASGLAIDPDQFMNGEFTLDAIEGTEGLVINQGIINAATGGSVTLVGQKVDNQGLITAKLGRVSLAAGKQAVLTFDKQGLLGVRVSEEVLQRDLGVEAAVQNSGEIKAEGGQVLITASTSQDIFSQAVNTGNLQGDTSVVMHDDGSFTLGGGADVVNTGTISADSATDAGEVVVLGENIESTGTISADAQEGAAGAIEIHARDTSMLTDTAKVSASTAKQGVGGDVKVLGNQVGVAGQAQIDASGANGGGQVLIGGDKQGLNDNIPNAEFVYTGEDTSIRADALTAGDGGRVIVYAEDSARIHGDLAARGGAQSGNGGFVETSGKKGFQIHAVPDITAEEGLSGTWLIDPYDITIGSLPDQGVDNTGGIFSSIADGAILSADTLIQALEAGGTVQVVTGDTGGTGNGDITIGQDIVVNLATEATLELRAEGGIAFQGGIDATGGTAGLNLDFESLINAGNITAATNDILTNGGDIRFVARDIVLTNANIDTSNGLDTNGNIILNALNDLAPLSLRADTSLTGVDAPMDIEISAGGTAQIGTLLSNTGDVSISAGTLEWFDGGLIDTSSAVAGVSTGGSINIGISDSSDLTLRQIVTNSELDGQVLILNNNGSITAVDTITVHDNLLIQSILGDVTFENTADLNLFGNDNTLNQVTITGNTLDINSDITGDINSQLSLELVSQQGIEFNGNIDASAGQGLMDITFDGGDGEIAFNYAEGSGGDRYYRSNGGDINFTGTDLYFPGYVILDPSGAAAHGNINVDSTGYATVPQVVYSQGGGATEINVGATGDVVWLGNLDYTNASLTVNLNAGVGGAGGSVFLGVDDGDAYYPTAVSASANGPTADWRLEQLQGNVFNGGGNANDQIDFNISAPLGGVNHKINLSNGAGEYNITDAIDVVISNLDFFNIGNITISGDVAESSLSLLIGEGLSQSGDIVVNGHTSISTISGEFTRQLSLNSPNNQFLTLSIDINTDVSARAEIRDIDGIALRNIQTNMALDIYSPVINQTGDWTFDGVQTTSTLFADRIVLGGRGQFVTENSSIDLVGAELAFSGTSQLVFDGAITATASGGIAPQLTVVLSDQVNDYSILSGDGAAVQTGEIYIGDNASFTGLDTSSVILFNNNNNTLNIQSWSPLGFQMGGGDDSVFLSDGVGNDTFWIDGGAGVDVFESGFSSAVSGLWVLYDDGQVELNKNAGSGLTTLNGFESLLGSDAQDLFAYVGVGDYENIGISIDGAGSELDGIQLPTDGTQFDVDFLNAPWSGIEVVTAPGDSGSTFTLTGGTAGQDTNIWDHNAADAFDVTYTRGGVESTVSVVGFTSHVGGSADDSFLINYNGGTSTTIGSVPIEVDGGAGTNSITLVSDDPLDWQLGVGGAGTLQGSTWAEAVSFSNLQNVTGSDIADTFTLADNAVYGDINTGAGADDVQISGAGIVVDNIFLGNGSDTIFIAADATINGAIDGGTGPTDTIDLSEFSGGEYNFETDTTTGGGITFTYTNFDDTIAGVLDGFFGGAGDVSWTFNNDGTFDITNGTRSGNYDAANFGNIRSGDGSNDFVFGLGASYQGNIEGSAAGDNSLQGNDLHDTWLINGINSGSMESTDGSLVTTFENIGEIIGFNDNETYSILSGGYIDAITTSGGPTQFNMVSDGFIGQVNATAGQLNFDSTSALFVPRLNTSAVDNIAINAGGDVIWYTGVDFDGASVNIDINSDANVILGAEAGDAYYAQANANLGITDAELQAAAILDSVGGDDETATINITAGGAVEQKFAVYSGGGDLSYSAFNGYIFGDASLINTDFSNATEDALSGNGAVTLLSDEDYELPDFYTQLDCASVGCGDLTVDAFTTGSSFSVSVVDEFVVGGDVTISTGSQGDFVRSFSPSSSLSSEVRGVLTVLSSNNLTLEVENDLILGDINVLNDGNFVVSGVQDQNSGILGQGAINIGQWSRFVAYGDNTTDNVGRVTLTNDQNSFGTRFDVFSGFADIVSAGDLYLGAVMNGSGTLTPELSFTTQADIVQISDDIFTDLGPAFVGDLTLSAAGSINMVSAGNNFSSVEILQGTDVVFGNVTALDIAGINAQSLTLDVNDTVTQSGALNISGHTHINASNGSFSVDLSDQTNQLNSLSINADFEIGGSVRIDESDGMDVQDIFTDATLTLISHDPGAAIIQTGDWTIDDSANNGVAFNLEASDIQLGNAGNNTFDLIGAAFNSIGWQNFVIDGALNGSQTIPADTALLNISSTGVPGSNLVIGPNASFNNVDSTSYITMGAGDDVATISADVPFTIQGGAGNDTITVDTQNLSIVSILGEAGTDTISLAQGTVITGVLDGGTDGVDDVTDGIQDVIDLSAFSGGEYNFETDTTTGGGITFTYTNFEDSIDGVLGSFFGGEGDVSWTFNNDGTFDIANGTRSGNYNVANYGNIRSGDGSNDFVFGLGASYQGNIEGSAVGDNSLQGNDLHDTWVINGINSGSMESADGSLVTTFENIGEIIGFNDNETYSILSGGYIDAITTNGGPAQFNMVSDGFIGQVNATAGQLNFDSASALFVPRLNTDAVDSIAINAGGDVIWYTGVDFNGASVNIDINSDANVILGAEVGDAYYAQANANLGISDAELQAAAILDSVGGDDEAATINITAGGAIEQKFAVYSGGGDLAYSATNGYLFGDAALINTDFSNATDDALSGNGEVTLLSDADYELPDFYTQLDCASVGCGDLTVDTVTAGDSYSLNSSVNFSVGGDVSINTGPLGDFVAGSTNIRGILSVPMASNFRVTADNNLVLGDINIVNDGSFVVRGAQDQNSGILGQGVINIGQWSRFVVYGAELLDNVGGVSLTNTLNTFGTRFDVFSGGADIVSAESLFLGAFAQQSENAAISPIMSFTAQGDITQITDDILPGGTVAMTGDISLSAAGEINIVSSVNNFNSVEILQANDVVFGNVTPLDIAGINAQSLTLDVSDTVTQSGALNITGHTHINATNGSFSVDLSDPTNQLTSLSINADFETNGSVRVDESDGMDVQDIFTNATLTLVSNDPGAAIVQTGDWTIDGSINTGVAFNLDASDIELGNAGNNTFDLIGATFNANSWQNLVIGGAISGGPVGPTDSALLNISGAGALDSNLVIDSNASFNNIDATSYITLGGTNDVATISADVPFTIQGGAGNDTITVDAQNLTIDSILGEAGSDTISLEQGTIITGVLDGGTDGTDDVTDGVADELVFAGGAGANEYNFETQEASLGFTALNFEVEPPITELTVFGGDGDLVWTFNLDGSFSITDGTRSEDFNDVVSVRGGTGTNEFTFVDGASFDGHIQGDIQGTNTLTTNDLIDTWIIDGINSGRVENSTTATATTFANIANLVSPTDVAAVIEAAGSIDGSLVTTSGSITQIESGAAVPNNWVLGTSNSTDRVNTFAGFEAIEATADVDSFLLTGDTDVDVIFGDASDSITGPDAIDTTWVLGFAADRNLINDLEFWNVTTINSGAGVNQFEVGADPFLSYQINADAAGTNSLLSSATADSGFEYLANWNITGLDMGVLSNADGSITIDFINVQTLLGGGVDDVFTLGSNGQLSNYLDGGAGQDRLQGPDVDATWSAGLVADQVTGIDPGTYAILDVAGQETVFTGVETAIGGSGDDYFGDIINVYFPTVIVGGAGTDTLFGGDSDLNSWDIESSLLNGDKQFSEIEIIEGGGRLFTASAGSTIVVDGDQTGTVDGGIRFQNGTYSIEGGAGTDDITLLDGASLEEINAGAGDDSITLGENISLSGAYGGAGSDTFYLSDNIPASVILDGGTDPDGLDVDILDGSALTGVNEYNFTTGDSTLVSFDSLNFEQETGFDGLTILGGTDDLTWLFNADDTLTISSAAKSESFDFAAFDGIIGSSGQNDFVLGDGAIYSGHIEGDATGTNTLTANDLINNWIIDGIDAGRVENADASVVTTFENIGNLIGSGADDAFVVQGAASVTGSVDGGLGNDSIQVISDAQSAPINWTLDAQNAVTGRIATFVGIESVIGGDAADVFDVVGVTDVAAIDGFGAVNELLLNNGAVTLTLGENGTPSTAGTMSFANINTIQADQSILPAGDFDAGPTRDNVVVGPESGASWAIDQNGEIQVSYSDAGAQEQFNLTGFNFISAGGSGADQLSVTSDVAADTVAFVAQSGGQFVSDGNPGEVGNYFIGFEGVEELQNQGVVAQYSLDYQALAGSDLARITGSATGTDQLAISGVDDNIIWTVGDAGGVVNGGSLNLAFTDVEALFAAKTSDAADITNTYVFEGTASGVESVQALRPGLSDDLIIPTLISFEALTGSVALNRSGTLQPDDHRYAATFADGNIVTFLNVQEFTGNGASSTISAGDVVNDWVALDGDRIQLNSGSVFGSFSTFTGGSDVDNFDVGLAQDKTFVGGAGLDTITGAAVDNNWTVNGVNSGTLNTNIQFAEIENIIGGDLADTVTIAAAAQIGDIDLGTGDDAVTFSGVNATADNILMGAGLDTVVLVDGAVINGNLDGGDDADTLDMQALTAAQEINFSTGETSNSVESVNFETTLAGAAGIVLFSGDTGDFTWTFNDDDSITITDGTNTDTFTGITSVRGGSGAHDFVLADGARFDGQIQGGANGTNTLYGNDLIESWIVSGINSGSATDSTDVNVVVFSNIANLVGSDAAETFTLADGAQIASIDAAGGDDQLLLGNNAVVGNFVGGLGADAIYAADQNNLWDFNAADLNGMSFAEVESFYGGALADTFQFGPTDSPVLVDGGDGDDTLAGPNADNTWDMAASTLNDNVTFANIENLSGGTGLDTLVGADVANDWTVSGDFAGSLADGTSTVNFSSMDTLQGGAQADAFSVADGVTLGTLAAGAGDDTITIGENVSVEDVMGEGGKDTVIIGLGFAATGAVSGGAPGNSDEDVVNISAYDVDINDVEQDPVGTLGFNLIDFATIIGEGVPFDSNGTNYWFITGVNSGYVRSVSSNGEETVSDFTDTADLGGGDATDYYIFADNSAAITGSIDGGAGDNQLLMTWSDGETDVTQDLINTWIIDGINSGSVQNASNPEGNVFLNIATIVGGSNQDLFTLQGSGMLADSQGNPGRITGGAGDDQLSVAAGVNNIWDIDTDLSSVNGSIEFADVEHLFGDANNDQFRLLSELTTVTQIDGGAGNNQVEVVYQSPATVDLGNQSIGTLLFSNIQTLLGNDPSQVIQGASVATDWVIDGNNSSIAYLSPIDNNPVNIGFSGFGVVRGGDDSDDFTVNDATQLSTALSGGEGTDAVDFGSAGQDIAVDLGGSATLPTTGLVVALEGIEAINGSAVQNTTLHGASDQSYIWAISGAQSGNVSGSSGDGSDLITFTNITAIRGGEHDDLFQVTVSDPLIAMDGGDAVSADFVDYSQVNANLQINLAQALSGGNGAISGVEGIRGNNGGVDAVNTAELIGSDGDNVWTISDDGDGIADGINDGVVTDGVNTVRFLDFNILSGGAGQDTFNQDGGVIIGELRGGAGNDQLNVNVAGANRGTTFDGGLGQDALTLSGAEADSLAIHTAEGNGGVFEYQSGTDTYELAYLNVEDVLEDSLATTFEVRGGAGSDLIALGNGVVTVNDISQVRYNDKLDVVVRAGANDEIEITENLIVADSLSLLNGDVITNDPQNTSITAQQLILDGTQDVGSAASRIRTNVDDLIVRNTLGDIALQEQNGLNIAEFLGSGEFDLLLSNGGLTNSGVINAADDFAVETLSGNVSLLGENQITGNASLIVAGDLVWENAGNMNIARLSADNASLESQRGIAAEGAVLVTGDTQLTAASDIVMESPLNDFNRVMIHDARDVILVDQNYLELAFANTRGSLWIDSLGMLVAGDVFADGIRLRAGDGAAVIGGMLNTAGGDDIEISANQIIQNGRLISGGATILDAVTDIQQNAVIDAEGDVLANAQNITAAEDASISGSAVNITASGDLTVQDIDADSVTLTGGQLVVTGGNVRASDGDIIVDSGSGSYTMVNDTVLDASNGTIRISAGTNVAGGNLTGNAVIISGSEVDLDGDVTATEGTVAVDGSNRVDVNQDVSGNGGVNINTGGTLTQNGNINANTGDVNVSAGENGNVNMNEGSAINVGQGNVNINAGRDVVVTEVVTDGTVNVGSTSGGIQDGNGEGSNITADKLVTNTNTGMVGEDTNLETNVSNVDLNTNTGNIGISNGGKDLTVTGAKTDEGNINIESEGNIALEPGSVVAKNPEGSEVNVSSGFGDVTQTNNEPDSKPAITSDKVRLEAENGNVGGGSDFVIVADRVEVFARSQGGNIVTPLATDRITFFSGSYKFEDQIVSVEPIGDIDPAAFTNVKSYFYNDVSVLLPVDQRFDIDEDEEDLFDE